VFQCSARLSSRTKKAGFPKAYDYYATMSVLSRCSRIRSLEENLQKCAKAVGSIGVHK
jgi:hypothetical protein